MTALTILHIALGVVIAGLVILLYCSTARHADTRASLKAVRADLAHARETLSVVDQLAPEFRKAFPRRTIWGGHTAPSGVNWENVRRYAEHQKAATETTFKERQLEMDKLAWKNARANLGKGKK
ncbi:hypothetical protein SEA_CALLINALLBARBZ_25 [Arthrobacter phage CallinAllBarbz]|uniref:Uncharacterized protein n=1 Tax=Arthrobacter phage CallinAllBarbz TaxID=3077790 RepID=A0AA96HEL6_9CAUD|nr:hypothetical protein SEA_CALLINALLBARBZ_25 [Arthrobacter phage CallinAllBarbz]